MLGSMFGFLLAAPVTYLGDTPLVTAIRHEKLDIVKYLVTECNVSANGEYIVMCHGTPDSVVFK